jgi:hypothetical protein
VTDLTPNLMLEKIPADTKAWAGTMNTNLSLLDAAVGAYFTLNNLQGVWENSHAYTADQTVVDPEFGTVWTCQTDHISASVPTTFLEARTADSTYWTVYSSPARARGAWIGPGTTYGVNDFVVAGSKYAVAIAANTSTADFDADVNSGYWSVLVDLSAAGSQVLPIPGGGADAGKFVVVTPSGDGYTISDAAAAMALLGGTSLGIVLFTADGAATARTAINAQVAGSYQAADATLAALSGATTTAYGISLLALANIAALKSALGLGTAAYATLGSTSGLVPVVPIDLTSMVTGVLPRANGGFTPTNLTNALTGNVSLNSIGVFGTGPTIAQGTSGTWYVSGSVCVADGTGAANFEVKLWDGTTVIASAIVTTPVFNHRETIHLSGIIASPAGNLRISVADTSSTLGIIYADESTEGKDSVITAFRIA